uniref:Protein TILLER ANGLE CONTROL 1 n=1 Tax=Medicago truncatula TaxID=3880 RepID=B7FHH6_MEDTR|nr:unknown [Medicago truncatula]
MKKNEPSINNTDNQALLKQVALTDMLGDWKDGILTIGTLGYDPLKSMNNHKEYFALEAEKQHDIVVDDDDVENFYDVEQEELNPLINNTFDENNFEVVICENHDVVDDDARKEEEMIIRNFKEIVEVPPMICHEIMEANDVEADQKKRITLADLFLADSDVKTKLDYSAAKVLVESSEKPNLKQKMDFLLLRRLFPLLRKMHVQ